MALKRFNYKSDISGISLKKINYRNVIYLTLQRFKYKSDISGS